MSTETAGETRGPNYAFHNYYDAVLRRALVRTDSIPDTSRLDAIYSFMRDQSDTLTDAQLAAIERVLGIAEGANAG